MCDGGECMLKWKMPVCENDRMEVEAVEAI